MTSAKNKDVAYFIFDVESVSDGDLIRRVRYTDEVTETEAIARYRAELVAAQGHDFIPYTYQIPVSVVIAKVRPDFTLLDIVALDEPKFRSHVITENFWRGWEAYNQPTFVSFNGRGFDIPLMELAAFKYGVAAPAWFNDRVRAYEQPRNRYNTGAHLDLQDLMVNYGASRFNGGLNLAATVLNKPGKIDVKGDMVQDMFNEGKLEEINEYCRCDVLDTYFVFLRTRVLTGRLTLERETEIVAETRKWLEERADDSKGYATYLEHWDEWTNPWATPVEKKSGTDTAPTDESASTESSFANQPSASSDADSDSGIQSKTPTADSPQTTG